MTPLWRFTSTSRPNFAVIRDAGITDAVDEPNAEGQYVVEGSYKQLMKVAAWMRWYWITSNGFNPIRVEHNRNGRQRGGRKEVESVRYIVLAHWGQKEYTLCTVTRL